eukprot:6484713-Amphidinium_carterae.2
MTLCQDPQMLHDQHALPPIQPVKHLCHELVTRTDSLCTRHCFQQSAKSVQLRASHISVQRLVQELDKRIRERVFVMPYPPESVTTKSEQQGKPPICNKCVISAHYSANAAASKGGHGVPDAVPALPPPVQCVKRFVELLLPRSRGPSAVLSQTAPW